jgi:hypothetical protein
MPRGTRNPLYQRVHSSGNRAGREVISVVRMRKILHAQPPDCEVPGSSCFRRAVRGRDSREPALSASEGRLSLRESWFRLRRGED